ncbi:hypothetical protein E1301_Tti014820 [Triplophysa tibetana]|uniref:Uncharacterized protein n=1 Tax=Triplophysa tibetana TaxID=1572043 RepID=A0A5A9PSU4_9TELE|nr:hypothetical protein E1301_Tti014820 [Triplophysa tibetana]
MGDVNVCLMLLLLWTLTAVCKDDDITCEDVTGHLGEELTLTCRISYQSHTCCMMMYKFINKDLIYREEFRSDPCIHLTSFSCPYTANEVTTTKITFFSQTTCGAKTREFTVNITDAVKEEETEIGSNRIEAESAPEEKPPVQAGDRSTLAVIISVLSCFIIIVLGFTLRKKRNTTNTPKFQRAEVCACEHDKMPPV